MKVLLIGRDAAGLDPASGTFSRWRLLKRSGTSLACVICTARVGTVEEDGLRAVSAGGRNVASRLWRAYRLALAEARETDLISAQDPFELGLIAWIVAQRLRKPFEIQDHGGFYDGERPDEPFWSLRKVMAMFLARRADAIRTVSPRSMERLAALGLDRKTFFLPISADSRFENAPKEPEPDHIVSVGRLVKVKRFDLLVKAFAVFARDRRDAKLTVIGEGPERKNLEGLAKKLGVADKVDFRGVGDPLPWLKKAGCFVLLSQHEGWGVAAVEAALAKVPILMTDTGCAGLLKAKGAALIVNDEDDVNDIAEMMDAAQVMHSGRDLDFPDQETWARSYVAHWQSIVKPKILVCVQAVDEEDALMGYFAGWLNSAAGHFSRITVLALRVGRYQLPPNVEVLPLRPAASKSRLRAVWGLIWQSWRHRRDYVGVYVRGDVQYVVLASWLWHLLGKKVVLWFAHYKPNALLGLAARFSDRVVTSVPEACAYRGEKLSVIGQAIDENVFPLAPDRVGPLKILMFGRVSEVKNVVEMVDEFRAAGLPGVELTIIGKPLSQEYGQRVTMALAGLENATWRQTDVPHAAVPGLLAGYDILINATPGSLDKVILEAAFSGVIPIAATGGVSSFLPDGCGFLRAPNPKDRVDALRKLAAMDRGALAALARRIAAAARAEHSLQGQLNRLRDIFIKH